MVESFIRILIPIVAAVAALAGFVALEGFFRNKLKELFEDLDYFIFFFLVWGYLLYAIGEVSYYLTRAVFADTSLIGIQDVYWSGGAFFTVISFVALAIMLQRQYKQVHKLFTQLLVGGAVIVAVVFFIVTVIKPATIFGYIYPLASSLIVAFAFAAILFSRELSNFGFSLQFFFIASACILVGDLFFAVSVSQTSYGAVALIGDVAYLVGYAFSAVAFVVLRMRMHALAFRENN